MDMRQDRELYSLDIKELTRQLLQASLGGEYSAHKEDSVLLITKSWDGFSDEGVALKLTEIPQILLQYAQLDSSQALDPNELLVLDVETTGLSRGSTLSFLIGLGYFEDGKYKVEQILLPEPDAELNGFDRLIQLLESHSVLVTFNGKSFDIPVLESRLLYHQLWLNLKEKDHIDLLHLARRLWKNSVPSCALESLEFYIMGQIRDQELDIEGALIPQVYLQYLVSGEVEPLQKVVMHNQLDLIYTMALMVVICDAIRLPIQVGKEARVDYFAVARLYQSQGHSQITKQILQELREKELHTAESIYELGLIHKREGALDEAESCFEYGASLKHAPSLLALAILSEQQKKLNKALDCTQKLISCLQSLYLPDLKQLAEASQREARLQKKLKKEK